jgi:hypothetical protein
VKPWLRGVGFGGMNSRPDKCQFARIDKERPCDSAICSAF